MATDTDKVLYNNRVGPVLRAGDLAQAVICAAEEDNPDKEISIEDKVAYIRVMADDELIIRQQTLEECLGRPIDIRELEVDLSSFAGQIEWQGDQVRFFFDKHF